MDITIKKFIILLICLVANINAAENYVDSRVELAPIKGFSSPTERYKKAHSMHQVEAVLNSLHATALNKEMFQRMIGNETAGFFGYHGGCRDYRIFQDIIRIGIEEFLAIPIRFDFHFLRVPGLDELKYGSAEEFAGKNPVYNDNLYSTMTHILSLNIALYQSWEDTRGFTPNYFLQNTPWKDVYFDDRLKPFFANLGINSKCIPEIFKLARKYVPKNKGFILQFFDASHENWHETPYALLDDQAFAGNHTHKFADAPLPSRYLINSTLGNFPQLRLVLNNYYALNPYSSLIMLRYQTMHPAHEIEYEQALRKYMRALPYDEHKAEAYRKKLLNFWLAQ